MALKKIIAAHWEKKDVEQFDLAGNSLGMVSQDVWVEQVNADLSAQEEAETIARWAMENNKKTAPQPLSLADELELLINQDAAAVKKARADYQTALASWTVQQQPLVSAWRSAETTYNATLPKD